MNLKEHVLAALWEQFARWEAYLATLNLAQRETGSQDAWTAKDVLAHLCAWQQRSVARLEAAAAGQLPAYPAWPADLDPEVEDVNTLNAWIYSTNRERPWEEVYTAWKAGYRRMLTAALAISERDLLDGSYYAWMDGYPLVNVLIGSYDHHQEHLEKLQEGKAV